MSITNFNFGTYTDKILQYANETFATMHHKFLKEIWGNSTINKLHKNQSYTNWDKGIYEVYIPSRDSQENNLQYSRIIIKVQPENSNSTKKQTSCDLMKQEKQPLGTIESELIIQIAPKQDKWGLVKSFKHRNPRGYFTAIFTNKSPEIVWKRVMDVMINFTNKRLDGFMEKLGFEKWIWKWAQNKEHDYLYYIILEKFSYSLRQSVLTLTRLYNHFRGKMRSVLKEIGVQNVLKQVIGPLKGLDLDSLGKVMGRIRKELLIQVELDRKKDSGLRLIRLLETQITDRRSFGG